MSDVLRIVLALVPSTVSVAGIIAAVKILISYFKKKLDDVSKLRRELSIANFEITKAIEENRKLQNKVDKLILKLKGVHVDENDFKN